MPRKTVPPRTVAPPKVHEAIDVEQARRMQEGILEAVRGFGLDPFTTVFEMIDFDEMNEVVSYAGFPNRYPHWRFGMEFETMRKSYVYGLHKIYELVINNDPCYAYLLKSNSAIEQKIVMAHVYGHSDFFKNNMWFAPTDRRMLDGMANHGARIKTYMDRHGIDAVEDFLDTALSVENMIDIHSMYAPQPRPRFEEGKGDTDAPPPPPKLTATRRYMEKFINPPEYVEEQKRKIETRRLQAKRFPASPARDALLFLCEHAPLAAWQRDVLAMIREEAYYFAPQHLTKILNEGWAAYWHSRILTEKALGDDEVVDYADLHAGVLGGGAAMNPYKLGLELFRDIETRWGDGAEGRAKIFEVRRVHSDVTFLDNFLTEEFCERHQFFLYRYNPQRGVYEIASREFPVIKRTMLFKLTNMGQPRIEVEDANFRGQGELLLRHRHDGVDLEVEEAKDTLSSVHKLWQRPVHLWTVVEGQHRLLSWDGREHKETNVTDKGP
jgi:stage V sporulation protein R